MKKKQLWTMEERSRISKELTDGSKLEDIVALVPTRTKAAVIREIYKTNGYSIRTMDDSTKRFFSGIKTRNRRKKESIAVKNSKIKTATDLVYKNKQAHIVAKKGKNSTKALRMQALDFLFEKDLVINSQSVKKMVNILSKFKKEVSQ